MFDIENPLNNNKNMLMNFTNVDELVKGHQR